MAKTKSTANNGAVAVRTMSGAAFINMAAAPGVGKAGMAAATPKQTLPFDQLNTQPWALWGKDNLLPQQMIVDIETCGILNSIIDAQARFALCEGMVPVIMKINDEGVKVIDRYVDEPYIIDFLETNNHFFQTFGWFKDLRAFGSGVARFILNKEKTEIATFQRDDVTETRFQKQDPKTKKISKLYYSAQWDKVIADDADIIFNLPLLDPIDPVQDLRDKAEAGIVEHAMTFRYPSWGKHYYSVPLWYAAYKWVKIAQGVPEMKAAMYENSMRLKYMVVIYEQYWADAYENWQDMDDATKDAKRNELYDEIDKCLVGAKNSHKTLYVDGKFSIDGKPQPYIEVKPIEDSTQPGEYLPDSAAANSEIAFANMWNNAMFGGNQKNGLYQENQGGSNVREGSTLQTIIQEYDRKVVQGVMNVIKRFNGWDKKLPGLEFIIPATMLTTLDTGAGSKPVITGGVKENNQPKQPDNGNS